MTVVIDVPIPVDPDCAKALSTPEQRAAAGQYLSKFLKRDCLVQNVVQALADLKAEALANGLTDAIVDAELEAWRSERSV